MAIDCDLREVTFAIQDYGHGRGHTELLAALAGFGPDDVVLYEVASPIDYSEGSGKGIAINKRRWMIYNACTLGWLRATFPGLNVRVAPSSMWTMNYPAAVRHRMAGCSGQYNHDVRECLAMLWFYVRRPLVWITPEEYLADL